MDGFFLFAETTATLEGGSAGWVAAGIMAIATAAGTLYGVWQNIRRGNSEAEKQAKDYEFQRYTRDTEAQRAQHAYSIKLMEETVARIKAERDADAGWKEKFQTDYVKVCEERSALREKVTEMQGRIDRQAELIAKLEGGK